MNANLERRACPRCGSGDSEPRLASEDFMLGIAGPFHAAACRGCGLLFQNPALPAASLGAHYPEAYAPYSRRPLRPDPAALRYAKRRLGYAHLETARGGYSWRKPGGRAAAETLLLPRFVPGGKLLEIACASGERLEMLRDLGWRHCSGIEYGEAPALRARALGFPVHVGPVERALDAIPDGSLDVVIASFVLEHLENPFTLVRRLAGKLRPGGQFLFSTLRVGAPDFRIFGKYWYNLDLPRHYTFFRDEDLLELVRGEFEVEGRRCQAAPRDYTGSAEYRARRENRPFDRLLLKLGNRIRPACRVLAAMGWASRVCIACRKRG
jgi:SAM-dependent methyltransferase